MITLLQKFQNLFLNNLIQSQNSNLNRFINNFSVAIFDDDNDFDRLSQKVNNSKIIVINKYVESEYKYGFGEDFFICCFECSLYIIEPKYVFKFLQILSKNKISIIYSYSKQIKPYIKIFNQDIKIIFPDKNNFLQKIPTYIEKNSFRQKRPKEIDHSFQLISTILLSFLLLKSYDNSKIDRSIQYHQLFRLNRNFIETKEEDYIELQYLGNGSSSHVKLIYDIKEEKLFALKIFVNDSDHHKLFQRELNNYKSINHPYFSQFYGISKYSNINCLVIEYIEGETLEKIIKKDELSIFDRFSILYKIFKIVEYIHNNGYIHRDLRSCNFILKGNNEIFLIDFGQMIKISSDEECNYKTNDFICLAPEIQNNGKFSYAYDIYIIYNSVIKYLYKKNDFKEYPEFKNQINEALNKCNNSNPCLRPKITELTNISTLILGFIYEKGYNVEQNYLKAKEYYELSAKQNNSIALLNLGIFCENGYGVQKDYLKAKEYYELSSNQNNSVALNKLGDLYYFGYGVEQNYMKAKEYYEIAAKLNNPISYNNLGYFYYYGKGIKQDYLKAKECFESAMKLNNPLTFLNLGNLYFDGFYGIKDFLKAKKYYEISAKYNNSEAIYKIGNLYYYGYGVEQNYLKALEFYKLSAKQNNSNSLCSIGDLYYYGHGVKQNYVKAKEYYDSASKQYNSDSLFKLGNLYLKGFGVEKNYLKALKYFELAYQNNNPDALFFLGDFYSSGELFEIDIEKAIIYFLKSSKIHSNKIEIYNSIDKFHIIKSIYNNYFYHSNNDLGLIYIIIFNDIDKGTNFIKEAAFGEYPYGQNNFGLLNEIYFNHIGNAEYMYQRSAKHNFALAEYNLGHLKEKENKIDESIEHYKKASEYEDSPLIFHSRKHIDKRLEISKTFIVCFTNLKLTEYYFGKSDFENSKKYFIKSLFKLINCKEYSQYQFKFKCFLGNEKSFFAYLKWFILNFPLFNLNNQQNLSPIIKNKLNSDFIHSFENQNNETVCESEENYINLKSFKKYLAKETNCFKLNDTIYQNNERKYQFSENEITINNEEMTFKVIGDLFDFIISKKIFKNIFISEIHKIILIMNEIIYTHPYPILFGRIDIQMQKIEPEIKIFKKDLNDSFYEGFQE